MANLDEATRTKFVQTMQDARTKQTAETMAAIGKLLTKAQKATYNKMIGEPFDLAKLRGPGGPGGPGRAGWPRRPRRPPAATAGQDGRDRQGGHDRRPPAPRRRPSRPPARASARAGAATDRASVGLTFPDRWACRIKDGGRRPSTAPGPRPAHSRAATPRPSQPRRPSHASRSDARPGPALDRDRPVPGPGPALAGGWTLPDESRGHRVAPLLLLSRPDVRDDLQLPAAMAAEVDRAIDDLHRKAAALKGQTGEAAVDGRRAVDEGQRAWLESHLTPDQRRPAGPARPPLGRPRRHGHPPDRRRGPRPLRRAAGRPGQGRRRLQGPPRARASDAEQHLAAQALAVLSDGQKLRWERMLGRPFMPRADVLGGPLIERGRLAHSWMIERPGPVRAGVSRPAGPRPHARGRCQAISQPEASRSRKAPGRRRVIGLPVRSKSP